MHLVMEILILLLEFCLCMHPGNHYVCVCVCVCMHAGRDWGQEEKGTTEDEMAGWHH